MTDRRFNDDEVSAIFQQATEAQQAAMRHVSPGEGMTLAELQEIGREAGISPELVAQAARSLDTMGQSTGRNFLGLPVGVGRTVELDRKLTDDEWDRLVVDLRETFDAQGRVVQHGSLRQWTNGNLHAMLEPTETGQRVRLRTVKGNSLGYMMAGVAAFGIGAATLLTQYVIGASADKTMVGFAVLGLALFALGAAQLPGWARRRRAQMEEIARRLTTGHDER